MDDKQFKNACKSAGTWFIANYFLLAKMWSGNRKKLVEIIYNNDKTDADIRWTRTRVNALFRIIENGREIEALQKVVNSAKTAKLHPESLIIAENILKSLKYASFQE